ncbi:MAG: phosphotransferase [Armatimonadota bacterium]
MYSSNIKEDGEVTSIFGQTKKELWPIVEDATGKTVTSFEISMEHQPPEPYGAAGEKEIPTFAYVAENGQSGRITVFVKRYNRAGPAEAEQYRFLLDHRAPMPQLYGMLIDSSGREILFIEYLDASREARSTVKPDGLKDHLALMAQFQAIQPSQEFTAWLEQRPPFSDRLVEAEHALELIWEHSRNGDLGEDLKDFCSSSRRTLRQLQSLVQQVIVRSSQMPQWLVHTDFSTENTGRRKTGERLVMDVEHITLGPRFFDTAELLGIPSERWYQILSRKELACHYLDEYARWGGTPPSLDAFLKDMGILWLASILRYMDLNLNRCFGRMWGTTPTSEDERHICRIHLYRTLNMFLAQYMMRGTICSVLDR